MEWVLVVLIVGAIPVAGVVGFFLALNLRSRTALLEGRLRAVEAELSLTSAARREAMGGSLAETRPEPEPVAAPPETPPGAVETAPPEAEPAVSALPPFASPPEATPDVTEAPPRPPRAGFEEQFGTRWAVWVGGVALALGGLFLVRYSMEQGLLGPGARVALGLLFALALVAAGEVMRRRETGFALPGLNSAHIPSVLTAAGTSTAFATVYAAYALYGMIGPGLAFVALGLVALLTLLAAALHGPALGALGLVAALGSPLLVESENPQYWPLVLYLGVAVAAAYALARLRLWPWLARAAGIGGALWGFVLVVSSPSGPDMAHVLLQTALAGAFLVVDPHRRTSDEEAQPDWLAGGVLLPFAMLGVVAAVQYGADGVRPAFAGAMVLMLLALGTRFPAAAACAVWAALAAVGTLALWPAYDLRQPDPLAILPSDLTNLPRPEALNTYLIFGIVTALAIAAAGLWRLSQGRNLPFRTAALLAGAATGGPLLALIAAYGRIAQLDRSLPFALAAGLLGLGFASAAGWLKRREGDILDAIRLGTAASASAAVAALALGLTFALERGMLTVAFALAALGTAHVAERSGIPALRRVVGALGLIVLARLVWDPTIVAGDLGRTPIFNWLLVGYGVPALAFFLAARVLERGGRDWNVRLMEALSLATAAFLAIFEIRHAINDGDIFGPPTGHLEAGLLTATGLVFSLVLLRVNERQSDILYQVALLVFTGGALVTGVLGLTILENPYLSFDNVAGGAVLNSLVPAYLLPAILAAMLAYEARRSRPLWYQQLTLALAVLLQFLYMVLEIRRLFQGPGIDFMRATGETELWAYSAALLAVGVALLAVGLLRDIRLARLASAGYIVAAIAKVFLVDLSNLEGAMRALSFIGLGLCLVGIGLAYQKLLVRRRPAEPAPAA